MDVEKSIAESVKLGPAGLMGVLAVLGILGVSYMLIDKIIAREDRIIEQEIQINVRLTHLEGAVVQMGISAEDRFIEWSRIQERQHRALVAWLRASCYSAANGDNDARSYCDDVK